MQRRPGTHRQARCGARLHDPCGLTTLDRRLDDPLRLQPLLPQTLQIQPPGQLGAEHQPVQPRVSRGEPQVGRRESPQYILGVRRRVPGLAHDGGQLAEAVGRHGCLQRHQSPTLPLFAEHQIRCRPAHLGPLGDLAQLQLVRRVLLAQDRVSSVDEPGPQVGRLLLPTHIHLLPRG